MPFVQTLRCSCEKIKGLIEKWRYRCEVPLNKDTEREREKERQQQQQNYYWYILHIRSLSSTRRLLGCIGVSKVQHHSLLLSPPPAGRSNGCPRRGTVGVGNASRSCMYGVAVQSVYVLLL